MKSSLTIPAVLVLLAACADSAADQPAGGMMVPVRVAPVTRETVALPILGTGTLGAKEEMELSFKVGGVIARITVDAGQVVRGGQLLAELQLDEANATVARTTAAAENADREYARAERLYADSVVTLAQLQSAETSARVARAELTTARFNQRYARITAPSDGVVLARKHEPGELVPPGSTVLTLASRSRGSVLRVGLADRDIVRVKVGSSAVVRFDALPGRTFPGRVSQLGMAAEPGAGTYLVDIHLDDATGLVSDLVGTAEIQPANATLATLIPLEALLEADGGHGTVFTLTEDRKHAERRVVTIGFLAGGRVAIASGLDSATIVVTQGAAYLRDGSAVEVLP
jgi:RND family efflux transporter MFP subunit